MAMMKTSLMTYAFAVLYSISACAQQESSMREIRILIPSPLAYGERLEHALAEASDSDVCFIPIRLPMIKTTAVDDSPAFADFVSHTVDYDYVVFCSRKAIDAYASQLGKRGLTASESIGYLAIGKDNEWMTRQIGRQPAFVSDEASPAGIVAALRQMPGIAGKRIAVLAPEVRGIIEPNVVPVFIRELSEIGTYPVRIPAYITSAADDTTRQQLKEMIRDGQIDCIAFTSGTEATVVKETVGNMSIPDKTDIACFGPYTARHVRECGMSVSFVSPEFKSFELFAKHLKAYYSSNHSTEKSADP